ncbi:hypothetical protein AA15973_2238 [Komagataeibacter sucrofermentans DSM 15973]|nr:hypothetical protein AA15973_2238 [Komagataeibacter sucrofermentans DSM 15973]
MSVLVIAIIPSPVKVIICNMPIEATIGQSPIGGRESWPFHQTKPNRQMAALPKRIAASHRGDTVASASFVTGQLAPQSRTITPSQTNVATPTAAG